MADEAMRQIVLDEQPRPFHTPESMAARYRPGADVERDTAPRRRPLQRDPLIVLESDQVLTRKEREAGREILRVFHAITASVAPRVAAYGERVARGSGDDLPTHLRLAYCNRYVPWRDWAGAQAATPRASLADLTLLVCVDGLGQRQVGQALGMDQRTVIRRLQHSLHGYCLLAGWVVQESP